MTNNLLIVLLGHVNGPDKKRLLNENDLSPVAKARCKTAAELAKRHPTAVILPTGAFGEHFNRTNRPHWRFIRDFLINKGIDEERTLPGTDSSGTFQDCLCARKVFRDGDYSEAIVITSDYHEERVHFILDYVFDGIKYSVEAVETSPEDIHFEELEEGKSFALLKKNRITPPLYLNCEGQQFPEKVYDGAVSEQKHYDTVSLSAVTGAIVLTGVLIQLSTKVSEPLPEWLISIAGAFLIFLLLCIYERAAASANTARETLKAIEVGFGQRGFSANYRPEALFNKWWQLKIKWSVRFIFIVMFASMLLAPGIPLVSNTKTENTSNTSHQPVTDAHLQMFANDVLKNRVQINLIGNKLGQLSERVESLESELSVLSGSLPKELNTQKGHPANAPIPSP